MSVRNVDRGFFEMPPLGFNLLITGGQPIIITAKIINNSGIVSMNIPSFSTTTSTISALSTTIPYTFTKPSSTITYSFQILVSINGVVSNAQASLRLSDGLLTFYADEVGGLFQSGSTCGLATPINLIYNIA